MIRFLSRLACLICISLLSTSLFSAEPNTDAVVLKQVSIILSINQSQLKLDQPFSKQTPPGDELDVVEIVMAIEEELNIEISDSALDRAVGVNGLIDLPKNLTIRKLQAVVAEAYKASLSSLKRKRK